MLDPLRSIFPRESEFCVGRFARADPLPPVPWRPDPGGAIWILHFLHLIGEYIFLLSMSLRSLPTDALPGTGGCICVELQEQFANCKRNSNCMHVLLMCCHQ
jgi:hypothetical protein